MFDKLENVEKRYEELNIKISDPEVISNQSEWKKLMKEHADIEDIVEKYREYKKTEKSIEELKEMLNDKRITYIAGNHDIMLADRIGNPNNYEIANLHHFNGGFPTWEAAENDPEAKEIMMKIRKLPKYAIYENADGLKIFMSHSGSTNIDNDEDLIWDRSEYINTKNHSDYDVIIHGHTSIPHLIEDLEEIHNFYLNDLCI